ncbi:MAG: hypothetical protein HY906_02480 [Deltaproteobacteria bacterium]|nr:hypothetical protein [Deltaproteobacteria bacterium]
MRRLAGMLRFGALLMLAPQASAAEGFVPCWADGKALRCQAAKGSRTLFEAAGTIEHATASAEGHVLFVAKDEVGLWVRGTPRPKMLGKVGDFRKKTMGELLGVAFDKRGQGLLFKDYEETYDGAPPAVATLPLPQGLTATPQAVAKLPEAVASPSGRFRIVRKPIRLGGETVQAVGIAKGAGKPRWDILDLRRICKDDYGVGEKTTELPCGLGFLRWLHGDVLVAGFGGGAGPGWSTDYIWRPGTPRAVKVSSQLGGEPAKGAFKLSPDGRRLLTEQGYIADDGSWKPAGRTVASTGLWIPTAAFGSTRPGSQPQSAPVTTAERGLVVDPAQVDLGDLRPGDLRDVTFKIRNASPAEVKNLRCAGAGFTFDPDELLLEPGVEREVTGYYPVPKDAVAGEWLRAEITCGAAKLTVKGIFRR